MGLMDIVEIKEKILEQINQGNYDFSNQSLFDSDVIAIAQLLQSKNLSKAELNFSRNNFGQEGYNALKKLNAAKLNVEQCDVTEENDESMSYSFSP